MQKCWQTEANAHLQTHIQTNEPNQADYIHTNMIKYSGNPKQSKQSEQCKMVGKQAETPCRETVSQSETSHENNRFANGISGLKSI